MSTSSVVVETPQVPTNPRGDDVNSSASLERGPTGTTRATRAVASHRSPTPAGVTTIPVDIHSSIRHEDPVQPIRPRDRDRPDLVARLIDIARFLRPENPLDANSRVVSQPNGESAAEHGVRMRRRNDPNP